MIDEHIKALEELAEFLKFGDTGTSDYVEDRIKSIPFVLERLRYLQSMSDVVTQMVGDESSDSRGEITIPNCPCGHNFNISKYSPGPGGRCHWCLSEDEEVYPRYIENEYDNYD